MNVRSPAEGSDTVSLVCALLVRFPEIASIRSMPGEGQVRFSFAIRQRLDRAMQASIAQAVEEHVAAFFALGAEGDVRVECEPDRALSFVHVTRDLETLSKDELGMLAALFSSRFGETLMRNPVADDSADDDPGAQDELVECAIDALRDPEQSKSLVVFGEEKRVLVYFLKSQKKAKASARR